MFIRLPPIPFYIGLFIASYIQTSYIPHIEIPNAVFWVLFSFLLLSVRPQSIGLGCFWLLIFTHWPFPAIHMNPTVLAVGFWLSFTLILSLVSWLLFRTLSITAFVCFIASAIVMRDRITYPMSWTWVALWGFLLGALEQTLPPEMPIGWHCFWTPVIFLLGLGIRPDKSTIRFFLWVIAFYVPRSIIAYFFFLLYFRSAERDRLFPFNLFRLKWRRSQPVWCPLSLNPEPRDSATADFVLCKTCDRVVGQSKLIMGSSKYLTRLEEWHDHETLQDLKHFISVKTSCRLCHLFWYSISKSRRDSLGMGLCSTTSSSALSSAVSSQSTEFNTSVLRVKIWEERPLSLYTFAGLFLDNKPLGARILIHREEVFQKRKSRHLVLKDFNPNICSIH